MRFFRRQRHPDLPERERPWAVIACGRLLLIQGAGLLFLAWLNVPAQFTFQEGWLAALLALLAPYALLSGFGFLRLHPLARNRAMLLQGAGLLLALLLYAGDRPAFIYPLMVYNIFMMLYLQHPDVRDAFPYEALEAELERGP